MEKKNKIIFIITGIIIIIVLLGSTFLIGDKTTTSSNYDTDSIITIAQQESETAKEGELKEFSQINTDKYLEYYSSSEKRLILIARPTCSYCQIAEPIIQSIAYNYDLEIYYLNTDEFSEEDEVNFINSNEQFSEGFGTPLLLVVANNEIVDQVDGLTTKDGYEEFFRNNSFIE